MEKKNNSVSWCSRCCANHWAIKIFSTFK